MFERETSLKSKSRKAILAFLVATICLFSTAFAAAQVSLSATSLSFDGQAVGTTSATQLVTMTNTGTGALSISDIAVTGTDASSFGFANNCGTSLAAGAACTIHGHFAPHALGGLTAAITITDSASGSPQSVALSGTGLALTSLSATSLSFGSLNVGAISATQSVTLTNTGAATVSFTSITVTGADASAFGFSNNCGTSLAPGANCTIHGHFAPTTKGALTAAIAIADNAVGSPQSIALSGTGLEPVVSLSATSLSFGSVDVGTTSASQAVTLTNTGNAALSVTGIKVTGTDASSFVFVNTCGTSLAAGANCSIHGHFGPTAKGALTAAITIADNASGSPQSIALSGAGLEPVVSLSASSLSFGSVDVGAASASQAVTLTNTGNAALSITGIKVTGTDASSFAFVNSCGTSLAAGANCSIHGHFGPSTAGALTAAITIADNASGSPQSVALSGTGLAPAVSLSATSLSFGDQEVGTASSSKGVTLTNTGSAALAITSITVTGTDATSYLFVNNCGTSLAAKASCTIHGHFGPTMLGAMTAAITLVDNASGSPQSIALSGAGVPTLMLQAGGSLPTATQNVAYSGAINASGGSGAGYVFTVNGTSIPTTGTAVAISDGISVSSTGGNTLSIAGTPTAAGTVTLTNVTVKDSASDTAGPATYTIAVTAAGYTVNGQIYLENSCGSNGTVPIFTVSINTNPVRTTTTNSNGTYTFAGIPNGTYTITPSISGPSAVFSPAKQTAVVNNGAANVRQIGATLGYTISGTVSYSGTKTGRTYLKLSCGTYPGTSIAAPGPFTIRGVWPGTYTLSAWTDNLGYGVQNASNPAGSTSDIVVFNANLSAVAVALADPAAVTLSTGPKLNGINGFAGGAFVTFDAIKGGSVELPTSYTVEWSTSESFGSVTGSKTFAASGDSPWIVSGIADGSGYYFRARAVAGSSTSSWSNVVGPATIGAPTGANRLSGQITFSQTAKGPLYVGVYDQNKNIIYASVEGSKTSPPTSPASYSVQVPTGSQYFYFAFLDQTNNGLLASDNIGNVHPYNMITPTLTVSGNTTKDFTLASGNGTAVVRTGNTYGTSEWGSGQSYELDFDVNGVVKQPVAVALISGANILTPQDIAMCNGCGYNPNSPFSFAIGINSAVPTVGAAYGVQVTYSDGTTETLSPKITALLPNWPTSLSPEGPVSATSTTPTLKWTYPPNAGDYLYQMWFADQNYETVWSIPSLYSNTNSFTSSIAPSIPWGDDPTGILGNTPNVSSLTDGVVYHWEMVAYDSYGNRAQNMVDYVPGFLPLSLPPANPGTLGLAIPGQFYSGSISAGGGYGGYTYAINGIKNCYGCTGMSLGDGLYVTNAQGTLNITGTPTATGSVSFEVWVRDQSSDSPVGPVTYTITISIPPVSLPAAESNPLGTPIAGVAFGGAINASGGAGGGNYAFTVNGASIPTNMTYVTVAGNDGLTFANSGDNTLWVAGTPTASGTFAIDVKVTDTTNSSNTASVSYSVVVGGGPNGANNKYLKGTYVCKFDGFNDSDGSRWSSLSSFYADGTDTSGHGKLTGGVWNMSTHSINKATTTMSGTMTGAYSIGADNNGLMTMNSIEISPASGTHSGTYAIALNDLNAATTTATEFRMVEIDDVGASPSGTHGAGLCYQATTSAFAASTLSGKSFVEGMQGEDESGLPEAMVARMTLSTESATGGTGGAAGGTIASAADDVFYIKKTTDQGSSCTSSCGTYTAPDAHGRFTTSIPVVVQGVQATAGDVVYIVDANRAFSLMTSGDGGVQSGDVRKQQLDTYSGTNLDGPIAVYGQMTGYENGSVNGYGSMVMQATGNGVVSSGVGSYTTNQSYSDVGGSFQVGGSSIGVAVPVTFDSSNPGRATYSPDSETSAFSYLFNNNSAFWMSLGYNASKGFTILETGWTEPQVQPADPPFANANIAGSYLMGALPPMEQDANDSMGEVTLNSSNGITGSQTEAGEGKFKWNQSLNSSDIAYTWLSTTYGVFSLTEGGTAFGSCIDIDSTKFVCIDNTKDSPGVQIMEQ